MTPSKAEQVVAAAKSKIAWTLAKLSRKLIALWMRDQFEIDGDFVQVNEILKEWRQADRERIAEFK